MGLQDNNNQKYLISRKEAADFVKEMKALLQQQRNSDIMSLAALVAMTGSKAREPMDGLTTFTESGTYVVVKTVTNKEPDEQTTTKKSIYVIYADNTQGVYQTTSGDITDSVRAIGVPDKIGGVWSLEKTTEGFTLTVDDSLALVNVYFFNLDYDRMNMYKNLEDILVSSGDKLSKYVSNVVVEASSTSMTMSKVDTGYSIDGYVIAMVTGGVNEDEELISTETTLRAPITVETELVLDSSYIGKAVLTQVNGSNTVILVDESEYEEVEKYTASDKKVVYSKIDNLIYVDGVVTSGCLLGNVTSDGTTVTFTPNLFRINGSSTASTTVLNRGVVTGSCKYDSTVRALVYSCTVFVRPYGEYEMNIQVSGQYSLDAIPVGNYVLAYNLTTSSVEFVSRNKYMEFKDSFERALNGNTGLVYIANGNTNEPSLGVAFGEVLNDGINPIVRTITTDTEPLEFINSDKPIDELDVILSYSVANGVTTVPDNRKFRYLKAEGTTEISQAVGFTDVKTVLDAVIMSLGVISTEVVVVDNFGEMVVLPVAVCNINTALTNDYDVDNKNKIKYNGKVCTVICKLTNYSQSTGANQVRVTTNTAVPNYQSNGIRWCSEPVVGTNSYTVADMYYAIPCGLDKENEEFSVVKRRQNVVIDAANLDPVKTYFVLMDEVNNGPMFIEYGGGGFKPIPHLAEFYRNKVDGMFYVESRNQIGICSSGAVTFSDKYTVIGFISAGEFIPHNSWNTLSVSGSGSASGSATAVSYMKYQVELTDITSEPGEDGMYTTTLALPGITDSSVLIYSPADDNDAYQYVQSITPDFNTASLKSTSSKLAGLKLNILSLDVSFQDQEVTEANQRLAAVEEQMKALGEATADVVVELSKDSWLLEGTEYVQEQNCYGALATMNPVYGLYTDTSSTDAELEAYACIRQLVTKNGGVRVVCSTKPEVNFKIVIKSLVISKDVIMANYDSLVAKVADLESRMGVITGSYTNEDGKLVIQFDEGGTA